MRHRKRYIAISDARRLGRQVGEVLSDKVHDLALPLDAAMNRHHAG
jgi:hypothetical protein